MTNYTILRRLSFLLLALLATLASMSQGSITGTIQDSAARKALQYATAELFAVASPAQPLRSAYTNDKGRFTISGLDSGRYLLIVSHTGFVERQVEVTLGKGEKREVEPFVLAAAPKEMAGVVIKSRKPLIETSDDKIAYNVANDPVAKTETAIDILRRTPFVSVDGDGNITVNGQSNFKVLLNGRETAMFAQNVKEALKGFPGALIVKIEVITSPSAKYDAEGVGGIINIITQKKVVGYNGSVNTYYTSTGWWNANSNFSAKYGKIGFTVYYGSGGGINVPGVNRTVTVPLVADAAYASRELYGKRRMNNFWNFGNGELNYEIDSLNTVSVYGNVSGGHGRNELNQAGTISYANGTPDFRYQYSVVARNEYPTTSVGADYARKFRNNKEREFSLRFNGEFGNSNSFNDAVTDYPDPATDRYVINNSVAKNKQYTVQSDYVHPMKNNQRVELGVKTILRRASSEFESLARSSSADEYKVNPLNTNEFSYDQQVYSGYGTYSFKWKSTTFRLGARYEHTEVDGRFTSGNTRIRQSYDNLLPNIQVSRKLGAVNLNLNFSQRLQRPYIWNLNPFRNNSDSLFVSYGNPDLQPQLIHSLALGGRMSKGGTFFGLTLTGTYSDNMIVQYSTFDKTSGVTYTTSGNVGKEIGINLSGNVNAKISEKWNLSVNGNVRYSRVVNRANPAERSSGYGGNANLNTNYNWSKRFYTYGYWGYFRNAVTYQTSYPFNVWYGIGTGVKLLKDKFNISLGLSNFLEKERDFATVTRTPEFRYESTSRMPMRGFSIGLTWNFGKMTENVSKKKGVSNDDLVGNGGSR
ncbi:TonB-dependent receptor [Flaviaesturariibacter terrae]